MKEVKEEVQMLEYIVKMLVENKDAVNVAHKVDEMGVLLTVDVALEDMGKLIGKQGNTAKAIRTIMRVYGMNLQKRINIKINEPEGSVHNKQQHEHAVDTSELDKALEYKAPPC